MLLSLIFSSDQSITKPKPNSSVLIVVERIYICVANKIYPTDICIQESKQVTPKKLKINNKISYLPIESNALSPFKLGY